MNSVKNSNLFLICFCVGASLTILASFSTTQKIECDEIKADDSYDGEVCTISNLKGDGNTEYEFIKNKIVIWLFIKKDLNFGWFKTIRVKDSSIQTIPRPFMTQYSKMEVLSMDKCGIKDWHPLTFTHAKNLRQLLLSRNAVEELPRLAFYNANVLETIDLQNNNIIRVDRYAFINLECLKELKLAFNKIVTLDLQIFSNANLKFLDVSHNMLKNLSVELESVFKTKLKKHDLKVIANNNQLELLNIQDNFTVTEMHLQNNQLEYLSTLNLLKHLQYLNLQSNPLKSIPITTFFNLSDLQYLNIRDTQMHEITGTLFSRLTKLKHLDLSNNNFTKIDMEILAAMGDLEELVLFNNALTEANAENLTSMFPHLKNVWISSNAWDCEDFAKFQKALTETGVKINTGKGKYGTEYKGGALCVPTLFL